jgi:hypothetical protein
MPSPSGLLIITIKRKPYNSCSHHIVLYSTKPYNDRSYIFLKELLLYIISGSYIRWPLCLSQLRSSYTRYVVIANSLAETSIVAFVFNGITSISNLTKTPSSGPRVKICRRTDWQTRSPLYALSQCASRKERTVYVHSIGLNTYMRLGLGVGMTDTHVTAQRIMGYYYHAGLSRQLLRHICEAG